MSRLASLLVQDAVVGVKAMEDALQRQAVFGGTLDTNLLEAGVLDETYLAPYLQRSTGLGAAEETVVVDARTEAIPRSLAGQAVAAGGVPVGLEGRTLQVLVTEMYDKRRLDDMAHRSGFEVIPVVTTEVRYYEALEMLWNVAMPPRLAALCDRLGRRAHSEPPDEDAEALPFHVEMPAFDPSPLTPEEAEGRFAEATDRDTVLEILSRALSTRFRLVAVFMVHGDHASGKLMIRGPFADREEIGRVSISLEEESVFRTAMFSHVPQLGPVAEDGQVLQMLGTLGHTVPPDALVFPVEIRGRVVCLSYCDNTAEPVDPNAVEMATWLASQASAAFLRLILESKGVVGPRPQTPAPPVEGSSIPPALTGPHRAVQAQRTGEFAPLRTGPMRPARQTGTFSPHRTGSFASPRRTAPVVLQGGGAGESRQTPITGRVVLDLGEVSAPDVARDLVDRLEREELAPHDLDYLRSGGDTVLAEVVARFPGRLKADRHVRREPLPPAAQCGPLLGVLAGWREALPQLAALAQSPEVERRFWATYLISERPFDEAYPTLVDRAFDPDPTLRALATSSLRRFASQHGFRDALARLHVELETGDLERQKLAVEAAGILRDPGAVPALIHHVGSDDVELADAAQRALALITRQDFGRKRRKWLSWYEQNQGRHQIEWLIEALGSKDEELRRSAEEDLRLLTGKDFGYHDGSSRSGREQVQRLWLRWWQEWGRRAFGHGG